MSVEDIASQGDPILGVYVFPGSVETLVTRGGITNHHFIVYSLSKMPKITKIGDMH